MKNQNPSTFFRARGISSILIILIIVGVLVIGSVVRYYQKTLQIVSQPIPQIAPQNETTNWETYIFSSTESEILPTISLKYPPFFNKIEFYSRKTRNGIEIITDDWGGFIDFRSAPNLFSGGLRLVFSKKINNKENFEKYVESQLDKRWGEQSKWDSIKYFQVDGHKAARTRFSTPDQYSSNNSYYYIELSNSNILEVNADGDKAFVYDDKNGDSTRDRIISTFKFIEPVQAAAECVGRFTFPAGEEKLTTGETIKISWVMPLGIDTYYSLDIDLLNESGGRLGGVIWFNWIKYNPITSVDWDTKTVYNSKLQPDQNIVLKPGKYKLNLSYDLGDSHSEADLKGCSRKGNFESNYFEIVR